MTPEIGGPVQDIGDWKTFLTQGVSEEDSENIRSSERTGRPLGDSHFLMRVEKRTGRILRKKKPGPKPKSKGN